MTDLAARRPPSLISVESPIAMQLMAEGLLLPVDDLVDKIGRNRPRRRRQVGILGRLEGQAVRRPCASPAAPPARAHGHRQGAGPERSRHLGLERPAQRREDDLAEEARHGRLLHGARPQPLHRLPLRGAAALGRRPHVRCSQQVRGRLRQPADGRGAQLRQGAAALHAEGRGGVQLPAGRRRARHRAARP